jgi:hypothetical protein
MMFELLSKGEKAGTEKTVSMKSFHNCCGLVSWWLDYYDGGIKK